MKKFICVLGIVAISALPSFAAMDSAVYTMQAIADAVQSKSIVLRGELEAVKVDVIGVTTGTVAIATAEQTLFSKASITADATFMPRAVIHTTAGVGATNTTGVIYDKMAMAGAVTVTFTGVSVGTTNNAVVTLVYKK
jgi:hypothetical protein